MRQKSKFPIFQTGSQPERCSWFGERARPGRSGLRPRDPLLRVGMSNRLVCPGAPAFVAGGAPNNSRGGCAPQTNCIVPAQPA
jgi:hypothetical protein